MFHRALLLALAAVSMPVAAQEARIEARFVDAAALHNEPPSGVRELAEARSRLDAEFEPRAVALIRLAQASYELVERRAVAPRDSAEARALADQYRAKFAEWREMKDANERDYAIRARELLGPPRARVAAALHRFATVRAIPNLRAASGGDLASLRNAGAVDLTAEFVRWYAENPAG